MKKGSGYLLMYPLTAAVILACVWWGSRGVTAFSENLPMERSVRIVIDPGHGGVDGGAVSCTGAPESRYNLEISRRLSDLCVFLGYETILLREDDVSLYTKGETIAQKKLSDLKERLRIIQETEDALLLSIHQNHFPDPVYSGAQVFYGNTPGSKDLAETLQESIRSHLDPGNHRRPRKIRGIYLMDRIRCTGVLIECGFLSNHQEEAMLRDPAYQKKLCAVIATGISGFLSNT